MKKNSTLRTVILVIIGVVIILLGYFGMKYLASLKEDPPKREIAKRIKNVETRTVANTQVATKLAVQGRLEAYNKIALFSEVGGVVNETGKPFKKGSYFGNGEVLLRIDDEEARLSLLAQKATLLNTIATIMPDLKIDYPESFPAWEAYLNAFDVEKSIQPLPTAQNQREKLFVAGKNLYTQYYTIKSGEERLSKYVIRAPFAGVLTSTSIDKGAIVRTGQQIGELMATGYYELVATVPLSQLSSLKTGGEVTLTSEDIAGSWKGQIRRISDQIDPLTQTVGVYVGVSGKELREGMYLRGEASAITLSNVVEIDRDLLLNEREVYLVKNDTLLSLHPVVVEKFNRETVIVSGIPEGAQLLVSEVAGAFDGMRVQTKNTGGTGQAQQNAPTTPQPVSR
ncbi:efflux RND transporter periplasmic adaptor subunit [Neolewinella lacunae]|uniref:Efflux RND transporter periplasmic adaptor subunit n=1 Tax=Neolewinella lacunae TaxID=1517758 RepID=A0A923PPF8_9BACT|nr:HlyD family efflux transporter periplasmic adaptor subunit [Neolewinella lacunae]MBC6995386.1 efflux RND transporter periplasmic adaptor subunit [Neolewinella lacunae]MDN3633098.1 efflux RND transporter periplasmic adaptor subunit [Neolewinella lacunae]